MSTYRHALELAGKTPTGRNRYVDFLRAASIIVVVLGHWLIAAPHVGPGGLEYNVLLSEASWTHYLTWVLSGRRGHWSPCGSLPPTWRSSP